MLYAWCLIAVRFFIQKQLNACSVSELHVQNRIIFVSDKPFYLQPKEIQIRNVAIKNVENPNVQIKAR